MLKDSLLLSGLMVSSIRVFLEKFRSKRKKRPGLRFSATVWRCLSFRLGITIASNRLPIRNNSN